MRWKNERRKFSGFSSSLSLWNGATCSSGMVLFTSWVAALRVCGSKLEMD